MKNGNGQGTVGLVKNLTKIPLRSTEQGHRVVLSWQERDVREDKDCSWVFLKVVGKKASKRDIDDFLRHAWNIKVWLEFSN